MCMHTLPPRLEKVKWRRNSSRLVARQVVVASLSVFLGEKIMLIGE